MTCAAPPSCVLSWLAGRIVPADISVPVCMIEPRFILPDLLSLITNKIYYMCALLGYLWFLYTTSMNPTSIFHTMYMHMRTSTTVKIGKATNELIHNVLIA